MLVKNPFGILQGLKIRKQRSTGDLEKRGTAGSMRSNASTASWMSTESSQSQASASMHTDSNASFVIEVGLYNHQYRRQRVFCACALGTTSMRDEIFASSADGKRLGSMLMMVLLDMKGMEMKNCLMLHIS